MPQFKNYDSNGMNLTIKNKLLETNVPKKREEKEIETTITIITRDQGKKETWKIEKNRLSTLYQ